MVEAWTRCDAFNVANPPGTKVIVRTEVEGLDEFIEKETFVTSPAWTLPNGEAVVVVDSSPTNVTIDRVRPRGE